MTAVPPCFMNHHALTRCYHIYDYLRKSYVKGYSAAAFHFALRGPFNRLRSACFHHPSSL